MLVFPDVSHHFWGCCVTQVSAVDFHSGMEVMDMPHEPLGFVSRAFCGSQLNWPTVDKEDFAIVATFRRVEYLLWQGFHIFCDHRTWPKSSVRRLVVEQCPKPLLKGWSTGAPSSDSIGSR